MSNNTRAGYVAIVGRPNVGKSTLLNHLLGKKLSITSRKPQTTRHRILGVKTVDDVQIMYLDTPGLNTGVKRTMNRYMNRVVKASLVDINLVLFVIEALQWNELDKHVLSMLKSIDQPVFLVINKIDKVADKSKLLAFIDEISKQYEFAAVLPISAVQNTQLDVLEQKIIEELPTDVHYYPPEQVTDRSDRFVTSEIIREKLMRGLGQELPYSCAVTVDAFEEEDSIIRIAAIIWVEKDSQKSIVIGKGGERLKSIGTQSRIALEEYFEKKVFVNLWVKVKSNWSDDERSLQQFGYEDS